MSDINLSVGLDTREAKSGVDTLTKALYSLAKKAKELKIGGGGGIAAEANAIQALADKQGKLAKAASAQAAKAEKDRINSINTQIKYYNNLYKEQEVAHQKALASSRAEEEAKIKAINAQIAGIHKAAEADQKAAAAAAKATNRQMDIDLKALNERIKLAKMYQDTLNRGAGGVSSSKVVDTSPAQNKIQAATRRTAEETFHLKNQTKQLNDWLKSTDTTLNKTASSHAKTASAVNSHSSAVDRLNRPLLGAARTNERLNPILSDQVGFWRFAGRAAALYFSSLLTTKLVDTITEMQSLNQSLIAVAGTTEGGARAMQFLKETGDELGYTTLDLAKGYKLLAASSKETILEGGATEAIFKSVVSASRALGLSANDTEGSLRALAQMISKGTVQSEELKGQLGERLPGAFRLAAKAMGVSTQELSELLEQGKVLAVDLLPKLATELDKTFQPTPEMLNGVQASTERMKQAFQDLAVTFGKAGGEEGLAKLAQTLTDFATSETTINFVANVGRAFNYLAENIDVVKAAFGGMLALYFASRTGLLGVASAAADAGKAAADAGKAAGHFSSIMSGLGRTIVDAIGPSTMSKISSTFSGVIGLIKSLPAVAAAGFAGFKLGEWLREEFDSIRIMGEALVEALVLGWETLSLHTKILFKQMFADVKKLAGETMGTLAGGTGDMLGWVAEHFPDTQDLLEPWSKSLKGFSDNMLSAGGASGTYKEEMAELAGQLVAGEERIKAINKIFEDQAKWLTDVKEKAKKYGISITEMEKRLEAEAKALAKKNEQLKKAAQLEAGNNKAKAAAAAAAEKEAIKKLREEYDKLMSKTSEAYNAQKQYTEELKLLNLALSKGAITPKMYRVGLEALKDKYGDVLRIKDQFLIKQDEEIAKQKLLIEGYKKFADVDLAEAYASAVQAGSKNVDIIVEQAKALKKLKKEYEKLTKTTKSVGEIFSDAFDGAFDSVLRGTKSFKKEFVSMIKGIKDEIIKENVLNPIKEQLRSLLTGEGGDKAGLGGLGKSISGLFSGEGASKLGETFNKFTEGFKGLFTDFSGTMSSLGSGISGLISKIGSGGMGGLTFLAGGIADQFTGASGLGSTLGGLAGSLMGPLGTVLGGIGGSVIEKLITGKPSDKTQANLIDLSSGSVTAGGELSGKKFSQENRNTVDDATNTLLDLLDGIKTATGETFESIVDLSVGSRDGVRAIVDSVDLGYFDSVETALKAVTNQLISTTEFVEPYKELQRRGEDLLDTLVRVGKEFGAVSTAADLLNFDELSKALNSESGLKLADDFDKAFNGMDNFSSRVETYFDKFYSDSDKFGEATETVTEAINTLGLTLPATREEFKSLVESLQLDPSALSTLLGGVDAFDNYYSTVEDWTKSITDTYQDLFNRSPDTAGLEYWLDQLMTGQMTLEQVSAGLSNSVEAISVQLGDAFGEDLDATALQEYISEIRSGGTTLEGVLSNLNKELEVAGERTSLQIRLLEAQGKSEEALAITRKKELESVDATNASILNSIYAAEDRAKAEAKQANLSNMQVKLLETQGRSVEALALKRKLELEAMSGEERAIQEKIHRAEDANTKAKEALSLQSLQIKLLEIQGNSTEALAITRKLELEAANDSEQAILNLIYAQEDLNRAIEKQNKITNLQIRLFNAQGKDVEALALTRKLELDAASDSEKAILAQIYAQEDLNALTERANTLNEERIKLTQEMESSANSAFSAWLEVSKGISDYLNGVKLSDLSPLTNRQRLGEAESQFMSTFRAAGSGDLNAAQNLTNVANTYLSEARDFYASSSSYTDIFDRVTKNLEFIGSGIQSGGIMPTQEIDQKSLVELENINTQLRELSALKEAEEGKRQDELLETIRKQTEEIVNNLIRVDATLNTGVSITSNSLAVA